MHPQLHTYAAQHPLPSRRRFGAKRPLRTPGPPPIATTRRDVNRRSVPPLAPSPLRTSMQRSVDRPASSWPYHRCVRMAPTATPNVRVARCAPPATPPEFGPKGRLDKGVCAGRVPPSRRLPAGTPAPEASARPGRPCVAAGGRTTPVRRPGPSDLPCEGHAARCSPWREQPAPNPARPLHGPSCRRALRGFAGPRAEH